MNTKNYKFYTIFLCAFLLIFLGIGIYWASIDSNVFQGAIEIFSLRWGLITVIDFYIGATVIGVWIGVLEKSVFRGLFWVLFIYLLGNLATLVYLIRRTLISKSFTEIFTPNK